MEGELAYKKLIYYGSWTSRCRHGWARFIVDLYSAVHILSVRKRDSEAAERACCMRACRVSEVHRMTCTRLDGTGPRET